MESIPVVILASADEDLVGPTISSTTIRLAIYAMPEYRSLFILCSKHRWWSQVVVNVGSCRCCWKLLLLLLGATGLAKERLVVLPTCITVFWSAPRYESYWFHVRILGISSRCVDPLPHAQRYSSTTCSTEQCKRSFTAPQSPKSWPFNGFQRSIGEQKSLRLSYWNEFLVPDSTLVKWNVDFCTDKIFFLAAFDFLSNCCFTSFVESSNFGSVQKKSSLGGWTNKTENEFPSTLWIRLWTKKIVLTMVDSCGYGRNSSLSCLFVQPPRDAIHRWQDASGNTPSFGDPTNNGDGRKNWIVELLLCSRFCLPNIDSFVFAFFLRFRCCLVHPKMGRMG